MPKRKRYQPFQKQPIYRVSKKKLRSQYEYCYIVAKKILSHFELKPELLDVFTKKHRERLLKVFYLTPAVKPERERTVPRQYIRNINTEMHHYLKNTYWGNPENDLTLEELATYGLSFLSNIQQAFQERFFDNNSPQSEAARLICEKFDRDEVLNTQFSGLMTNIYHQTRKYSKINFRMYGFAFDCEKVKKPCGCCFDYRFAVWITAKDSESKIFRHNNIERKAFRMYQTEIGFYKPSPATIERKKIFPKAKENDELNIYIQSHVLHRFKERMDIIEPSDLNIVIQGTFTINLKFVSFERRVLFVCSLEEQPIGYFTFFVQDNDIVISTFLPLTSVYTPEGKKLHEILSLTKEELIYLGMDKISFLLTIDFEQIPKLKQALVDANIWKTKMMMEEEALVDKDIQSRIDLNKTNFVKSFLDKKF